MIKDTEHIQQVTDIIGNLVMAVEWNEFGEAVLFKKHRSAIEQKLFQGCLMIEYYRIEKEHQIYESYGCSLNEKNPETL